MSRAARSLREVATVMGSEMADLRRQLARYHGAVSAWCDLTGQAQAVPDSGSKTEKELALFEKHTQELRHARRMQF